MRAFLQAVDDFLRGRGPFAVGAPVAGRLRWLFAFVLVFGAFYGVVMGTFSGLAPGRFHQLLYSGAKVPLLMLVTFALCLPSFFVVNTVAGLRDDFLEALQAVVAAQSCISLVLACLAPLTALFYASCADYHSAILLNGVMFAVAWVTAQVVVRRYYAPLIRRSPTHRTMLYAWFLAYVFVGIQMAWVLRPFVGAPGVPVTFFRQEAWGNAYVVVGGLIGQLLGSAGG
jgi:hypothetical protein